MLGFPILYCKGMRPMRFQLSGFCYKTERDSKAPVATSTRRCYAPFPHFKTSSWGLPVFRLCRFFFFVLQALVVDSLIARLLYIYTIQNMYTYDTGERHKPANQTQRTLNILNNLSP